MSCYELKSWPFLGCSPVVIFHVVLWLSGVCCLLELAQFFLHKESFGIHSWQMDLPQTIAWSDWHGVRCPHTLILYSAQGKYNLQVEALLNCRLVLSSWSTKIPKLWVQLILIFFNHSLTFTSSTKCNPFL